MYEALTTTEGIRNWWTRDAQLDDAIDGTGTFRFHDGASVTTVTVKELEPPLHVMWKTAVLLPPQWAGTTIHFDLRAEKDGTAVSFAHRGFAQADDRYAQTTTGWGIHLQSLKDYLETGTGNPRSKKTR